MADVPAVLGRTVDDQTRCVHYHSPLDIVAIRFKCCGKWYPCYKCHDECERHAVVRWEEREFGTRAVLCGVCGRTLAIRDYLGAPSCPHCGSPFNAGCRKHYGIYFAVSEKNASCALT